MSSDEEALRLEFNHWAEQGLGERMEEGHGDVTAQILDRIAFGPGDRVLDVGCGTGWAVRWMSKRGAGFAAGSDLSDQMLRRSRKGPGMAFLRASSECLPFLDATFSIVLSVESLYYCSDLDRALGEIRRICRLGGQFLCMVDLFQDNPGCRYWPRALGVPVHFLWASQYVEKCWLAGFSGACAQFVKDRRPILSPERFEPSKWFPDYDSYRTYREIGSLLIEAVA